jgi:tRNA threonylcarbamoyladenosine biosynthesis protein TsaB
MLAKRPAKSNVWRSDAGDGKIPRVNEKTVSIAIETSSRLGGVALGVGDECVSTVNFDASQRHATQLVSRLDELLSANKLRPADLQEVYVSAGPGSFTGVRVGVTVARTLGASLPGLRCVAVPTPLAVAQNARSLDWRHLGVILDTREGLVYAALFARNGDEIVPAAESSVLTPREFLARAPRPLTLIGEGLGYHDFADPDVEIVEAGLHTPTAEGVWRVGHAMARRSETIDYRRLLPIYARKPEAVRLWDQRHGEGA